MTVKVVINSRWGGFSLSKKASEFVMSRLTLEEGKKFGFITSNGEEYINPYPDINRDHPALVAAVETLGDDANGECAALKVVSIPDDVEWYIHDYDGMETIHEKHRSWC